MVTWNTKISGNDTFQDIYQYFFDLYNQGQNTVDISAKIQVEFAELFNDHDDGNNCFFGLALAQWAVAQFYILLDKGKVFLQDGSTIKH